jgi:hypothetical protein
MFIRNKSTEEKSPYTYGRSTAETLYDRRRRQARRANFGSRLSFPGFFMAAVVLIGGGILAFHVSQGVTAGVAKDCVVTNTTRSYNYTLKRTENLIFTSNCDVLEVKDNILAGEFNSASIFGQIQTGHTYTFETRGQRIPLPFQHIFPSITKVTEVK